MVVSLLCRVAPFPPPRQTTAPPGFWISRFAELVEPQIGFNISETSARTAGYTGFALPSSSLRLSQTHLSRNRFEKPTSPNRNQQQRAKQYDRIDALPTLPRPINILEIQP